MERLCRNYNVPTTNTLQQTCHWARLLGGAFCCWCGGDLSEVTRG